MDNRTKWFLMRIVRFFIIGFLVLTIIFILPRIMPGDPISNLFGENASLLNEDAVDVMYAKYHLDDPLWEQYLAFLKSIFTFDYGYSIISASSVNKLIAQRLPWTLALTIPSLLIGSIIGFYIALYCGTTRKITDKTMTSLSIFMHTMPTFLIAMIFVKILAFDLGLFPLSHNNSGTYSGGWMWYLDSMYHLLLPCIILIIGIVTSYYLTIRNSVLEVNNEDYIFVAESKGLTEEEIRSRHVSRNALPVFLSIFAMGLGGILSGALIIELVFSLNGMGTLLYQAISRQDYPVIQGIFILLTMWVLLMNLVAEFVYGLADPRIGDSHDRGTK